MRYVCAFYSCCELKRPENVYRMLFDALPVLLNDFLEVPSSLAAYETCLCFQRLAVAGQSCHTMLGALQCSRRALFCPSTLPCLL